MHLGYSVKKGKIKPVGSSYFVWFLLAVWLKNKPAKIMLKTPPNPPINVLIIFAWASLQKTALINKILATGKVFFMTYLRGKVLTLSNCNCFSKNKGLFL